MRNRPWLGDPMLMLWPSGKHYEAGGEGGREPSGIIDEAGRMGKGGSEDDCGELGKGGMIGAFGFGLMREGCGEGGKAFECDDGCKDCGDRGLGIGTAIATGWAGSYGGGENFATDGGNCTISSLLLRFCEILGILTIFVLGLAG